MGAWEGINQGLAHFNQAALGLLRLDQQERENAGLAAVRNLQAKKIGMEMENMERMNELLPVPGGNQGAAFANEFADYVQTDLSGKKLIRRADMIEARKTTMQNPDIQHRLWSAKLEDLKPGIMELNTRLTRPMATDDPEHAKNVTELQKRIDEFEETRTRADMARMAAMKKAGLLEPEKKKDYEIWMNPKGQPEYIEKGAEIKPGYTPYVKTSIVEHKGKGGGGSTSGPAGKGTVEVLDENGKPIIVTKEEAARRKLTPAPKGSDKKPGLMLPGITTGSPNKIENWKKGKF